MGRHCIGIDLGTTHSALSYLGTESKPPLKGPLSVLPIPQLTAPGTVESRLLLPSFLYLPLEGEFPAGSLKLPWDAKSKEFVGEWARSHGAKVSGNLVSSAKSWLSHPGVDRRSPILPWQAAEGARRLSPLDASARYLKHLASAWNHALGKESPLAEQDIVITVPASFDAAARDLTLEAAKKAGLPEVVLLEEPQAALYAWLNASGEDFRSRMKPGDVILVVDVGGGTSDFSLISVDDNQGNLELRRLAVGDHILLGGDNMDLALAYGLSQKLASDGKKLDAWQMAALAHGCRQAKEELFARPELSSMPISVPSRGSSLMGGTVRTELSREELQRSLVEGFFPPVPVGEQPTSSRRSGLQQMGLPYAQDAAITRHLAFFLSRQAQALHQSSSFVRPTSVLFNGGVFKAEPLKARLLEVLNRWLTEGGSPPARELPGADLDLAVARGAAYYAWVRRGNGIRIRGGTAKSYYVGVESSAPAIPGVPAEVRALCVAPFGMEEGTSADIPPQEFGILVGEPTRFRFFSSSVRRDDKAGQFVDDIDSLSEMAPIETALEKEAGRKDEWVPVNLQAAVTELGSLELRCLERGGEGKWKLELNVREGYTGGH
jgi:hypothetical protein